MSQHSDARQRALALTVYRMRKAGRTNREIALTQSIDVKRVPTLVRLGETLSTVARAATQEGEK